MADGVRVLDYPQGDGKPDCTVCLGRGVVPAPPVPGVLVVGERLQPCPCVRQRDILANVERGWRGLTQAPKIPSSPLLGLDKRSLWISAPTRTFRAHLRHVALRSGPHWGFVVVSDADLMDAWLARVDDHDIYDGDVEVMRRQPVTSKYGALVDMVEPPELLVILTGVKVARNSAMPEVLLEALRHREHLNKPTWIVDQPDYPLKHGHISYSSAVADFLGELPHVKLKKIAGEKVKVSETPVTLQRLPVAPFPNFDATPEPEEDQTEDTIEEAGDSPKLVKRQYSGNTTRSELDAVSAVSTGYKKKAFGRKGGSE